jgi:peptidoglycan/LPS O-acetylase OafA/YrhL
MQKQLYMPHVDGLRAIAVLSVILYHLGFKQFSGGYVGVDIFFVISGFLITRLIREEYLSTGKFSFSNFYIRRFRRLFPAFLATLAICFIVGALLLSNKLFSSLGHSTLYAIFSLSNIYFWKKVNYFTAESGLDPLLHTWSLSVEEQFYLFWPILIIFFLKNQNDLKLRVFILASFIISLFSSFYYINNQLVIFYLLPFRVFEFCIGAMVVWLMQYKTTNQTLQELMIAVGLGCIFYPIFNYTNTTIFPSYNALMPCFGAALLIYSGDSKYLGLFLSNKLMVGIGLISYSLYLVHWPLIIFYKYYQDINTFEFPAQISLLTVSILFAYLMYRYIEQPYRKQNIYLNKKFFSSAITIVSFICVFSFSVYTQNGWAWRTNTQTSINSSYGGDGYQWQQVVGEANVSPVMTIYGDSHSKQYISSFDELGKRNHQSYEFFTHSACLSLPDITNLYQGKVNQSCIDMYENLKTKLRENNSTLLLAYRYTKNIVNLKTGEEVSYKQEQQYTQMLLAGLSRMLEDLGKDQKVIIFGGVPSANINRGYIDCVTAPFTTRDCYKKYPIQQGEFADLRDELKNFAKSREQVQFLDPYDALCDKQFCHVIQDDQLYYSDHAHLTKVGTEKVIHYFSNVLLDTTNFSHPQSKS